MPTYIRPRRAIIEPDGGARMALLLALAVTLAAAVVSWAVAHAVLLACCLAVFCAVMGGFCGWCRWATSPRRLERGQAARWREQVEAAPPARDIPAVAEPAPKRAAWPQLGPGGAEDVAAALRRSSAPPGESP
jgi:hypothetical protein